jgi:hypothetical protein
MNKKRTDVDFSQHKLVNNEYKMFGDIWSLKLDNTQNNFIKFINIDGLMVVTGDRGNWIFNREFKPDPVGYVSDGYWVEKLMTSSCQNPYIFDGGVAREQITDLIKDNDYKTNMNLDKWLNDLLECDVSELKSKIEENPENLDFELLPDGKKLRYDLLVVFDAFDEICDRLKNHIKMEDEIKMKDVSLGDAINTFCRENNISLKDITLI